MNGWIGRFATIALLAGLQGCIALPVPNRSVDAPSVESQVVDAQTRAPIPHAGIYDPARPDHTIASDASGHFHLPRVVHWHAGYLWGPVSFPIWPFTTDIMPPVRTFNVVAAGYEEQRFTATHADAGGEASPEGRLPGQPRDKTLYVPTVPMRKR